MMRHYIYFVQVTSERRVIVHLKEWIRAIEVYTTAGRPTSDCFSFH